MPKVSEFFGVSVYVYFRDHPPPHFHARYGDTEAIREALLRAWRRACEHRPLGAIDPLR